MLLICNESYKNGLSGRFLGDASNHLLVSCIRKLTHSFLPRKHDSSPPRIPTLLAFIKVSFLVLHLSSVESVCTFAYITDPRGLRGEQRAPLFELSVVNYGRHSDRNTPLRTSRVSLPRNHKARAPPLQRARALHIRTPNAHSKRWLPWSHRIRTLVCRVASALRNETTPSPRSRQRSTPPSGSSASSTSREELREGQVLARLGCHGNTAAPCGSGKRVALLSNSNEPYGDPTGDQIRPAARGAQTPGCSSSGVVARVPSTRVTLL